MSKIRAAVGIAISAATIAGTMTLSQIPASAATDLGGVELNGYCQSQGYWGVTLLEDKPWGWKCYIGTTHYGINMDHACQWQYPRYRPLVYAVNTRPDALGWRCYI